MRVIMDLEANGLLTIAHTLHCAVFKDIDTEIMYGFEGWSLGLENFLNGCTMIAAHNGIDFDMQLLKKLFEWVPEDSVEIVDTLVMSRLLNPDRPPVQGTCAPHGVEAWGKRLGRWKPDHTDWSVFTPEMLHRCKEDVEIQFMIYKLLCEEAEVLDISKSIFDTSNYGHRNWSDAFRLEHASATIIAKQAKSGCYFDVESAATHVDTLTGVLYGLDKEILALTTPNPKKKGTTILKPFKVNGLPTKAVIDWFPDGPVSMDVDTGLCLDMVAGPFSRIEWVDMNIGSDKQLKEWLNTLGWEPDEWNYSKKEFDLEGNPLRTSPKLTETSFESLPKGLGQDLQLRSKSRHRRSQIQGWIGNCRDDHRIEAQANSLGTPTGRMKHRIVANVPKPNVYNNKKDKDDPRNGSLVWYPEKQSVFFGTEMRSLFRASPGMVLVGRDASGLELRCFAHYLNDSVYTDIVLSGDIHSHNQMLAGLPTRNDAKTFILIARIT